MKAKEIHFTKKKEQLRKRIIRIANYMIQNQQGLTKTAMRFKTTKEQIEGTVNLSELYFGILIDNVGRNEDLHCATVSYCW